MLCWYGDDGVIGHYAKMCLLDIIHGMSNGEYPNFNSKEEAIAFLQDLSQKISRTINVLKNPTPEQISDVVEKENADRSLAEALSGIDQALTVLQRPDLQKEPQVNSYQISQLDFSSFKRRIEEIADLWNIDLDKRVSSTDQKKEESPSPEPLENKDENKERAYQSELDDLFSTKMDPFIAIVNGKINSGFDSSEYKKMILAFDKFQELLSNFLNRLDADDGLNRQKITAYIENLEQLRENLDRNQTILRFRKIKEDFAKTTDKNEKRKILGEVNQLISDIESKIENLILDAPEGSAEKISDLEKVKIIIINWREKHFSGIEDFDSQLYRDGLKAQIGELGYLADEVCTGFDGGDVSVRISYLDGLTPQEKISRIEEDLKKINTCQGKVSFIEAEAHGEKDSGSKLAQIAGIINPWLNKVKEALSRLLETANNEKEDSAFEDWKRNLEDKNKFPRTVALVDKTREAERALEQLRREFDNVSLEIERIASDTENILAKHSVTELNGVHADPDKGVAMVPQLVPTERELLNDQLRQIRNKRDTLASELQTLYYEAEEELSSYDTDLQKRYKERSVFSNSENVIYRLEGKESSLVRDLDEVWSEITRDWTATTQKETLKPTANRMRDLIAKSAKNPEAMKEDRADFLEAAFSLRDSTFSFTGAGGISRHLCWQDAKEARAKSNPYVEIQLLRDMYHMNFMGMRFGDVVEYVDQELFNNFYRFENPKYNPTKPPSDGYGNPPENARWIWWSYAAYGDPDPQYAYDPKTGKGVKPLIQMVKDRFPRETQEMPQVFFDTLINFIIVSEMRMDVFYKQYFNYRASPVHGIDGDALLPWGMPGYITYKAISSGGIPKYRQSLVLFDFPDETDLISKRLEEGVGDSTYDSYINVAAENRMFAKQKIKGGDHRFSPTEAFPMGYQASQGATLIKDYPKDGRGVGARENIKKLVQVRDALEIQQMGPVQIGQIKIGPDMKILPSPMDFVRGNWRGVELPAMTMDDLFDSYRAFGEFVDAVEAPVLGPIEIQSLNDAATKLDPVIGTTSQYKGFAGKLIDVKHQDYVKYMELMTVMYMRRLFLGYLNETKEGKFLEKARKSKRTQFLHKMIETVGDAKTFAAKKNILERLDKVVHDGPWSINDTALFFNSHPMSDLEVQEFFGTELWATFSHWMRVPTPKEKDTKK